MYEDRDRRKRDQYWNIYSRLYSMRVIKVVRLEEWRGWIYGSRVHRIWLLTGKERGKGKNWGDRHPGYGWRVGNDYTCLTKEEDKELADSGIRPDRLLERGRSCHGWEGLKPATYPVTGLRNSALKWSVFLVFSSTVSKYKLKYDFEYPNIIS